MPRESTIQKNIVRWLKTVPNCEVRNLHGSVWAVAGDPDIYGCINGRMFLVEVKQPGEQLRPLQKTRVNAWKNAGAVAGVARSVTDAQFLLLPLLPSDLSAEVEISRWDARRCFKWFQDNDLPTPPPPRDIDDYEDASFWQDSVLDALSNKEDRT